MPICVRGMRLESMKGRQLAVVTQSIRACSEWCFRCYEVKVCVPPKFICQNLVINVMIFRLGALEVNEVMRVEPSQVDLVPL